MRIDNINFLRNQYMSEYKKIANIDIDTSELISCFPAKNNQMTATIQSNGQEYHLASAYDPSYESEVIISQYTNINDYDYVIFYGTGLGYHINAFVKKYPEKKIFIFEPIEDLFSLYCKTNELPEKNIEGIFIGNDIKKRNEFFSDILKKIQHNLLVVELPIHKKLYNDIYKDYKETFSKVIAGKKGYVRTNYAFQKRWVMNGMHNFSTVLQTQNILLNDQYNFKDKTAILVAAGPSLDFEIENLREIKENKSAYIFSAGWSISTLLKNGIYPHAFTSYDPTVHNTKIFKVIGEESEKFPLVFGSTIGHETLSYFKGPKLHMITSQDTTAPFYLKSKDENMRYVMDAPNIAVITLQLLVLLGFKKVVLVGQNFAYSKGKAISDGYVGNVIAKGKLEVPDVYGGVVETEKKFNDMRVTMEHFIEKFANVEFINTTRNGAMIKGTSFKHLDELMQDDLIESFADDNWYKSESINYDVNFMEKQMEKMQNDFENISTELTKIKDIVRKVKSLAINGNFKQAETMYAKLSGLFGVMKKNVYFNRFIMPMNRLYYDLFLLDVEENKHEKNPMKKAENIVNTLGKFLFECEKDMKKAKPIYEKIQTQVGNYIIDSKS